MKKIILLLTLFISVNLFSQNITDSDEPNLYELLDSLNAALDTLNYEFHNGIDYDFEYEQPIYIIIPNNFYNGYYNPYNQFYYDPQYYNFNYIR